MGKGVLTEHFRQGFRRTWCTWCSHYLCHLVLLSSRQHGLSTLTYELS